MLQPLIKDVSVKNIQEFITTTQFYENQVHYNIESSLYMIFQIPYKKSVFID